MKYHNQIFILFFCSLLIIISNDTVADLNRCVTSDKRIEFTEQPCPSDTQSQSKRQEKSTPSSPTRINSTNDASPVLHVIGVYEGLVPPGVDGRPWWERCKGELKNRQNVAISAASAPSASSASISSGGTSTIHKCDEIETNINVNITDNTRPIVLALMAYNKNLWVINLGKGVTVKKLILAGYHSQRVSGLPLNIPIETYTYDPSPCENCSRGAFTFHSDESSPPQLKELTGLDASSFQGGYKGGSFSIFPGMHIVKSLSKENNWEIKAIQDVVKPTPSITATDPQVLLDQAVLNRIIRKATAEDVRKFRDAYIDKKYASKNLPVPTNEDALSVTGVDISRAYVVLKEFTYPPGMINEKKVVFFIPKGILEPKGEYGHSAIYDFETLTVWCSYGRNGSFRC